MNDILIDDPHMKARREKFENWARAAPPELFECELLHFGRQALGYEHPDLQFYWRAWWFHCALLERENCPQCGRNLGDLGHQAHH